MVRLPDDGEELLAEILEPTNWRASKTYGSGDSDYIAILSKKSPG